MLVVVYVCWVQTALQNMLIKYIACTSYNPSYRQLHLHSHYATLLHNHYHLAMQVWPPLDYDPQAPLALPLGPKSTAKRNLLAAQVWKMK